MSNLRTVMPYNSSWSASDPRRSSIGGPSASLNAKDPGEGSISRVTGHHDRLCFLWAIRDAHGQPLNEELNVGELRSDGLLTRMIVFPDDRLKRSERPSTG